MRTASPSLAAVCRQSSGCCLPFLYPLLHWSVMSVDIGNCSLSVWWEAKTCRWNPASADSLAKEEGNGCFLSFCICCVGLALGFELRHFCLHLLRVKGVACVDAGEQLQWAGWSWALSNWVCSNDVLWHLFYCYLFAVSTLHSLSVCGCILPPGWVSASGRVGQHVRPPVRKEFRLWAAADDLPRNSISRKCPGEPGRCLFSNPEPGDDTRVMPFWVN